MPRKKEDTFEAWRAATVATYGRIVWPKTATIRRNAQGQLHCETAPAIETPLQIAWYVDGRPHGMTADRDGTVIYYHRGIIIPQRFFEHPETVTFKDVISQKNAEVRFVTMRIYGYERALLEGHLKVISTYKDDVNDYTLLSLKRQIRGMEYRLVRVLNNTPDPDGTFKPYYMCVPPDINDPYEAVAWTFRRTASEYRPVVQT